MTFAFWKRLLNLSLKCQPSPPPNPQGARESLSPPCPLWAMGGGGETADISDYLNLRLFRSFLKGVHEPVLLLQFIPHIIPFRYKLSQMLLSSVHRCHFPHLFQLQCSSGYRGT